MTHGDPVAPDPQGTTKATETAKSTSATANEGARSGPEGVVAEKRRRSATVNLPFMTAEFRAPDVHLPGRLPSVPHPSLSAVPLVGRLPRPRVPDRRELGTATRVVGSFLPERDQLALFAGLGAGAVAGVLDWPVAAAVAAGTLVAKRGRPSEAWLKRPTEAQREPKTAAPKAAAPAASKAAPSKTAAAKTAGASKTAAPSPTPSEEPTAQSVSDA